MTFFLSKLFIPLHAAKIQAWQPHSFSSQRPHARHTANNFTRDVERKRNYEQ